MVYLMLIIFPRAMTSMSPAGCVKQIQNIYRLASRTGSIPYAVNVISVCNHMEQQFPAVVSSVLPVSNEKGYSNWDWA